MLLPLPYLTKEHRPENEHRTDKPRKRKALAEKSPRKDERKDGIDIAEKRDRLCGQVSDRAEIKRIGNARMNDSEDEHDSNLKGVERYS